MKRKLFVIPLALLVVVILAACAAPASAPAPTVTVTAPAPAPAPEPAMEPQKWNYLTYHVNVDLPETQQIQQAFDRIKERTNGALSITALPVTALPIKSTDQLRAVGAGEVEMCLAMGAYHRGDFPPYQLIGTIPYLYSSEAERAKVYYATLPILQREMAKMNIHALDFFYTTVGLGMFTVDPVDDILDLGKRKMRAYDKGNGMVVEALNATPVTIAWAETFTSLEKGIVEGLLTGKQSILNAKIHEVCPYGYEVNYPMHGFNIVVNKDRWDALPTEVQEIMEEELSRAQVINLARIASQSQDVINKLLATGLKSWDPGPPPDGFFDIMQEKVTKPLLLEAKETLGPLADEIIKASEAALAAK